MKFCARSELRKDPKAKKVIKDKCETKERVLRKTIKKERERET